MTELAPDPPWRWSIAAVAGSVLLHAIVLIVPLRLAFANRSKAPEILDPWAGATFESAGGTALTVGGAAGADESVPPTRRAPIDVEVPITTEPLLPDPARVSDPIAPISTASPRRVAARQAMQPSSPGHTVAQGGSGLADPANTPASVGAEGVSGVRDFGRAFARALPPAVSPDSSWGALASGPAGQLDLKISVDDDGHAVAEPLDVKVPAHWRALVARAFGVLTSGRFALTTTGGGGSARVHLTAVVSHVAVDPSTSTSGGAFGFGFDPPSAGRAGRAFWTLATGQHVDITVRLVEDATNGRH